jgi:Nucleotidyl transferase AbiEii toxin, Type IV TA system
MDTWVNEGPENQREFREAVEVVVAAVTGDPDLGGFMVMKGGLLMGIRYHSPRFTTDIDFSSSLSLSDLDPERIGRLFDTGMARASAKSDSNLECRVQSLRVNPPNRPDASFPSIELKIGYAYKGTPKHRRLMQGQSPSVLSIDLSLNETIVEIEALKIDGQDILRAYSINDLVAEKIRSLLQQTVRNRYRRQDVFDLNLLLNLRSDGIDRNAVLQSLKEKSRSRGIEVRPDSLDDPEVKRRAFKDYHTLANEVSGPLPDFESAYDGLLAFYRSLPW